MRAARPTSVLQLLATLLAITLVCSACSRRANDAPDPEQSASELQQEAKNIAEKSRQAIQQAEAALQESAAKIDDSLETAGAVD